MPITWRHEFECECEVCGEILTLDDCDTHFRNPTPKTFSKIAKKDGWKLLGNKCWCVECQNEMVDDV